MENNEVLFKKLIAKKNGFQISSYENRWELKKLKAFLKQYHPLEINPKYVESQIEELCEKLEIHSLDYKSKAVRRLYKALLQCCDKSLDFDHYLLINGVILFLLEISGSMVNSYEYAEVIEVNEIIINEEINWSDILTKSEDIISLTQLDFQSDISSEYSTDSDGDLKTNEHIKNETIVGENYQSGNHETHDYNLIKSNNWDLLELKNQCQINLQSEYWLDSFDTKYLSRNLMKNPNFSSFSDNWENYYRRVQPEMFEHESRNRIELSEYQLIRESIDILIGSMSSSIFRLESDPNIIGKNRFKPSRSVKLINLSWHCLDNILHRLAEISSYRLRLRLVAQFVSHCSIIDSIAPSIVAFSDRLHAILDQFSDSVVRRWERSARSTSGLTLLELLVSIESDDQWANRLQFLDELAENIACGRFETLRCRSAERALLDWLYRLLNESCLLDRSPIDELIADLFIHALGPYLHSLDGLLSGQSHRVDNSGSDRIVFINQSRRFNRFHNNDFNNYNYNDSDIDIVDYWNNRLSLKTENNASSPDRYLIDIPMLLHPFVVKLISTVKSIDFLHLLSIQLTKPSIIDSIIIEPGQFIDQFSSQPSIDCHSLVPQCKPRSILDRISQELALVVVSIDDKTENLEQEMKSSVESINRKLHHNLLSNIFDRYCSVNSHLISVFIEQLQLKRALHSIKSIHFYQAGVEMSEFLSYLFDQYYRLLLQLSSSAVSKTSSELELEIDIDYHQHNRLSLDLNVKFHQILNESIDCDLKAESDRFLIQVSPVIDSRSLSASSSQSSISSCLPSISIDYQLDCWLKLVLTDEVRSISDHCFRFLLELRFAKYCLETELHCSRKKSFLHSSGKSVPRNTRSDRKSVNSKNQWSIYHNRLCALRLKLLQIINNLHSYIMNSFIIPSWVTLNAKIDQYRSDIRSEDFCDFIDQIVVPFRTMARGCLQTVELEKVEKAVKRITGLAVETTQIDVNIESILLMRLEEKYSKLVDFIAAMLRSLSHLGVSIGELDLAAFK